MSSIIIIRNNIILKPALLCLFCCSFCFLKAQDTIPFIKGKVNISIRKGTMECHLIMSNIPRIEDYVIRLNAGMNIRYFRDHKRGNLLYLEKSRYDSTGSGESLSYYFPAGSGKYLPGEIEFRYLGMYPVFSDTTDPATEDWRGNVAFNDKYLRVDGYQSTWYPVLFDLKRQQVYAEVKYDLDINCEDCSTLYINGSKPVKAKRANFKNEKPCEIALMCGNYDFSEVNGIYILNPAMTKTQQQKFAQAVTSIRGYLGKKLETKSSDRITFIQTSPVANEYAFSFVAYPSIINVGAGKYSLSELSAFHIKTIAHELGHSYFAPRLNSPFKPVINEGFAEYMALKASKEMLGDSIYQQLLQQRIRPLTNFKPISLDQIRSRDIFDDKGFREIYIYYFTPVILLAIEKETNEEIIWKWMRTMMTTNTEFTDYDFFLKTLKVALQDDKKLTILKEKYLSSAYAIENAIKIVRGL